MESEIMSKLISNGTAGLLSAICLCAVVILWRQMTTDDARHCADIKDRENRIEDRLLAYQTEQKEIFNKYAELASSMAEVTARATAAVENNTQVLQDWGIRIERITERMDRLEAK